jgi:hypothetical protein
MQTNMRKRVVKSDESESNDTLLLLVKKVSNVVGETLAYTICEVLQCTRDELAMQTLTNEDLHKWYQIMLYRLQRYHWRYAKEIQVLQAIVAENSSIETIKKGE